MKIVHFIAGLEEWNGMANTARQFMAEERVDGIDSIVTNEVSAIVLGVDVVYIHGAWLPVLWRVAKCAKAIGAKLMIRPAGSYDPVRLAYHGWKKRLVSFFEHRMLRRADVVVATCEAEREWILKYEPRVKDVQLIDIKRFFNLNHAERVDRADGRVLHFLYLGRRHPLKGLEFLECALKAFRFSDSEFRVGGREIAFRAVSNAFGEEKDRVWDWCDVLVLPTLSENFGRVVAEALERGKRVITTDGAPAWGEGLEMNEHGSSIRTGYGGRLLYLTGYRDGTDEDRVRLLKTAITEVCK